MYRDGPRRRMDAEDIVARAGLALWVTGSRCSFMGMPGTRKSRRRSPNRSADCVVSVKLPDLDLIVDDTRREGQPAPGRRCSRSWRRAIDRRAGLAGDREVTCAFTASYSEPSADSPRVEPLRVHATDRVRRGDRLSRTAPLDGTVQSSTMHDFEPLIRRLAWAKCDDRRARSAPMLVCRRDHRRASWRSSARSSARRGESASDARDQIFGHRRRVPRWASPSSTCATSAVAGSSGAT